MIKPTIIEYVVDIQFDLQELLELRYFACILDHIISAIVQGYVIGVRKTQQCFLSYACWEKCEN